MSELMRLRLAKGVFALLRPSCWRALARGVAPSIEHREVLRGLDCDLIMDVGANRGQFTLMAGLVHPRVRVHAYEPLPSEAAVFRAVHGDRPGVSLHVLALGDEPGEAELHVSGRADSSSLLPIGELQARLFPSTAEVGRQRVSVVTLDSLPEHWRTASRALLKLDVQGFELNVLRGATEALRHCAYVYAECSEVPLYSGQALRADVEEFLLGRGLVVVGRHNPSFADGKLVQADYLFGRVERPAPAAAP